VSPRIESVEWSEGATPEAMVDAFGEAALTLAVLEALLSDPVLQEKARSAVRLEADAGPADVPIR